MTLPRSWSDTLRLGGRKALASHLLLTEPRVLAGQLCLFDHDLMCQIDPTEILTNIWRGGSMTEDEKLDELPHLMAFIDRFNKARLAIRKRLEQCWARRRVGTRGESWSGRCDGSPLIWLSSASSIRSRRGRRRRCSKRA